MVEFAPVTIDIMKNIIFRQESVYYITKLLQSRMPKKYNRFTKIMLSKFIVPYIEEKLADKIMLKVYEHEIEEISSKHHPHTISFIKEQYHKYDCINCNKICFCNIHHMQKTITVYTKSLECVDLLITGVSFCSLRCQAEFDGAI